MSTFEAEYGFTDPKSPSPIAWPFVLTVMFPAVATSYLTLGAILAIKGERLPVDLDWLRYVSAIALLIVYYAINPLIAHEALLCFRSKRWGHALPLSFCFVSAMAAWTVLVIIFGLYHASPAGSSLSEAVSFESIASHFVILIGYLCLAWLPDVLILGSLYRQYTTQVRNDEDSISAKDATIEKLKAESTRNRALLADVMRILDSLSKSAAEVYVFIVDHDDAEWWSASDLVREGFPSNIGSHLHELVRMDLLQVQTFAGRQMYAGLLAQTPRVRA